MVLLGGIIYAPFSDTITYHMIDLFDCFPLTSIDISVCSSRVCVCPQSGPPQTIATASWLSSRAEFYGLGCV